MKNAILFLVTLGFLGALPDVARASYFEEWNLARLQKRYSSAVARPVPWVGFWWPYSENGLSNVTQKLDSYFGYNNWISSWEYSNHGQGRGGPEWFGHCNGWATAAIMESEPRRAVSVNGTRFDVPDRKGLLTEYWMESGSDYMGSRVWDANDTSSDAFWDVVPAQFHLALTNIVGRQGRSFIIDRYTGVEVWNQPLVGYRIDPIRPSDYLGPDPEYPNVYRVNVTTTIWWANDEVDPDELTPEFKWKENMYFTERTLRYELWVDAPLKFESGKLVRSGDIILTKNNIGGVWKNGMSYESLVNSHPDFIWIPLSYASSTGEKNPRINDEWVRSNISNR